MDTTTAVNTLGLPLWPVREDELRTAWRHYARHHHPDQCPDDSDAAGRFDLGRRAYEALRREVLVGERPPTVLRSSHARPVRGTEAAAAAVHSFEPLTTREWRA